MVNVNTVKVAVESLASKDQAGYLAGDVYNSFIPQASITLLNYYYSLYEINQKIPDSLRDFIEEIDVTVLATGEVVLPSDYVHRFELGFNKIINNQCGEPTVDPWPVDYMDADEVKYTLSSPIRKPSLAKNIYRHEEKNGNLYVYPKNLQTVSLKYLRRPTTPVWGFTDVSTPTGDFQQYDPNTSVDFEWQYEDQTNLVDLVLFYLGMEIRETVVVNFAKMKQSEKLIG